MTGHTFEPTTLAENAGFNLIGFKAARIDADGNVEVFQVGRVMDGAESPPVPRWPSGNPYGQPVGSPVLVDDGNIVDTDGNVLIPKLKGVDPNDGLYEAGEFLESGRMMESDGIIRLEVVMEKDGSGAMVDVTKKRTDITTIVENNN